MPNEKLIAEAAEMQKAYKRGVAEHMVEDLRAALVFAKQELDQATVRIADLEKAAAAPKKKRAA